MISFYSQQANIAPYLPVVGLLNASDQELDVLGSVDLAVGRHGEDESYLGCQTTE